MSDGHEFNKAAASLRSEFGSPLKGEEGGASSLITHHAAAPPPLEQPLQSVKDQLEDYIRENGLEDLLQTREEARGLVITLVSDNLLFPVGEATLRAPALSILDRIGKLLRDLPNLIVIEGHTCSLPISTDRYPSNWELSAARASAVVRYLAGQWQIDPQRLAATGYADSRPVAPNDREENRAQNRRVEIVLLASGPPAEAEPETVISTASAPLPQLAEAAP
jgi:flagellar motor protein MotB